MEKKHVPEWLNSFMWFSASTPSAPQPVCHSSETPMGRPIASGECSSPTIPSVGDSPCQITATRDAPPQTTARRDQILCSKGQDATPPNFPSPADSKGPGGVGVNCDQNRAYPAGSVRSSPVDVSHQVQLMAELSKRSINMKELRKLASEGLPDGAGIRSTVWKILLGYLPTDRTLWSSELEKKRLQYMHFKEELLLNPSEISHRLNKPAFFADDEQKSDSSSVLSRSDITHEDHPLSLGSTSIWNNFFKDSEVVEQIDRDVKRTHPDMHFFSGDSSFANSNRDSLRNVLIIFAKLNPGIRYVQGMNEILAPIYYIFRTDPDEADAAHAEADSFFCFVELLSGFRDHFVQQLDNTAVGIRSTMAKFSGLVKEHDEELWHHLEIVTKVNPQFYAFRWITLLLTQEFNFADSLHIWDTLLSDPDGPLETLLRVCCSMLILIRRRLLAGDFTSNLKLLQKYPPTNIGHLLYVANKLRGGSSGIVRGVRASLKTR